MIGKTPTRMDELNRSFLLQGYSSQKFEFKEASNVKSIKLDRVLTDSETSAHELPDEPSEIEEMHPEASDDRSAYDHFD